MDFCYCFSRLTFSNSAPAVIQDWRVFEHKKIFIGDCGGQIDSAGEWTAFSVSLHGSNMHKCNYWGRVGIAETNQPRPPPSLKSVRLKVQFICDAIFIIVQFLYYHCTALSSISSTANISEAPIDGHTFSAVIRSLFFFFKFLACALIGMACDCSFIIGMCTRIPIPCPVLTIMLRDTGMRIFSWGVVVRGW